MARDRPGGLSHICGSMPSKPCGTGLLACLFEHTCSAMITFSPRTVKHLDASVAEMIFPVGDIIEFVSAFMTLEPGDLIATGTPPGVGPILPGSTVSIDIEGLGILENPVVRG